MANWGKPDYIADAEVDRAAELLRKRLLSENKMACWPFQVAAGASPDLVREYCVNDAEWQQVRLSMKGKPTHEKLAILKAWFDKLYANPCCEQRVMVQVVNYLGALRRGGQLDEFNRVRKYL